MGTSAQIFQTDSRKRWTRVKWTGRVIAIIVTFFLVVTILAVINATIPTLPNIHARAKALQSVLDPPINLHFDLRKIKSTKALKIFWKKTTGRFN
jgi:hypothetical protein